MELLYEHTIKKQQAQINRLENQNNKMMTMMEQLMTTRQGSSSKSANQVEGQVVVQQGGSRNTVVVDNKRVVINVFGKECVTHITRSHIKEILDRSLMSGLSSDAAQMAVLRTAMLTHSDLNHPENLTCYLTNKKTDDALVHTENGWEVQPASLVLTPMAVQSINVLFDKQPFENAKHYEAIMRELRDNGHLGDKKLLRPILVRNKKLLEQAFRAKLLSE